MAVEQVVLDNGQGCVLRFQGPCGVERAGEFHQALQEAVRACEGLTLDLSGVEKADLSFYQLLAATRKTLERLGKKPLKLVGVPHSVLERARNCGLEECLQLGDEE
jgi:anti-anti-sigma regulatory factor